MLLSGNFSSRNKSIDFNMSSTDHTNLYKSWVKTIRARKKASGESIPNTRIFPTSNGVFKNVPFEVNAQFFQRLREIQENIIQHKKLLLDHRKRYLGQMNDPSSMNTEECVYMEQIIGKNLSTIEDQLSELEIKVPNKSLHLMKKKAFTNLRLDHPESGIADDSKNGLKINHKELDIQVADVEKCMALMTVLVRADLQALNTFFSELKENRNQKLSIKAKLMRFHRPASVKKASQLKQQCSSKSQDSINENRMSTEGNQNNIEDTDTTSASFNIPKNGINLDCESNGLVIDDEISDINSLKSIYNKNHSENTESTPTEKVVKINDNYTSVLENSLGAEEIQLLEQENVMMYNELQSTHEEVKNITKQVAELGRLQSVLMENVEEQATVADSVLDTVLHATDDVQEGNEQIREAMRKDASFRVGIMIFLIVMSCTILFLDWYNP